jgi:hypothetical protein
MRLHDVRHTPVLLSHLHLESALQGSASLYRRLHLIVQLCSSWFHVHMVLATQVAELVSPWQLASHTAVSVFQRHCASVPQSD